MFKRLLGSIWLPLFLVSVLCVVLGVIVVSQSVEKHGSASVPELVTIVPRRFIYRSDGAYLSNGVPVDAPMVEVNRVQSLRISKFQITNGQYGECVKSGDCMKADTQGGPDYPVVGVSHDDALAYARWLSNATGRQWTLPSDEDTAFAAGRSFPDDATGLDPSNRNPALRWIADYERETSAKRRRDPRTRAAGGFSTNEFGLADFGGNVWEWTSTCDRKIDKARGLTGDEDYRGCGIFIAVGAHRSPTSAFIRDPKGGGCSVGTPPDNLGFRIVLIAE